MGIKSKRAEAKYEGKIQETRGKNKAIPEHAHTPQTNRERGTQTEIHKEGRLTRHGWKHAEMGRQPQWRGKNKDRRAKWHKTRRKDYKVKQEKQNRRRGSKKKKKTNRNINYEQKTTSGEIPHPNWNSDNHSASEQQTLYLSLLIICVAGYFSDFHHSFLSLWWKSCLHQMGTCHCMLLLLTESCCFTPQICSPAWKAGKWILTSQRDNVFHVV